MVFKVEKNKNFVVMSNHHLKEKNMSLKAKGLLSLILSLPDNWDYSQEGLVKLSNDAIYVMLSQNQNNLKLVYFQIQL